MSRLPKISVITPSLNSDKHLECAVESVLKQNYPNFEHIIVDGGSTDGTLQTIGKYPHLRWISEPDRGESDAMNKGFRLSEGEVIVYLNADDYFEEGAFHAVASCFLRGARFVVGKVRVIRPDGSFWINDPQKEFRDMLKWWRPNSFCFNPVGYFYRREVQEAVGGFDVHNAYNMDLDFLLKSALKVPFTKIDRVLGNFRLGQEGKTSRLSPAEHDTLKARVCDQYLGHLKEAEARSYAREKERNISLLRTRDAAVLNLKRKKYVSFGACLLKFLFLDPSFIFRALRRIAGNRSGRIYLRPISKTKERR
jgi:glycosyltransferase involved in cell wall biosynthesis